MMEVKDIAAVIAAAAAVWGICVYFLNSRLRRAEWLSTLYEKFYENSHLKKVREVLDCEGGESADMSALVREEPAEFSDYLNFFEFVAVLKKSGQLKSDEVEDLFGYYLDCLEQSREVRAYVAKKGYERLDQLLRDRSEAA